MFAEYAGIKSEAMYYVPLNKVYEVWCVKVTNNSDKPRKISVFGYAELSNDDNYNQDQVNLQYTLCTTNTSFRKNKIYQQINLNWYKGPDGSNGKERFFGLAGQPVTSYNGDKEAFVQLIRMNKQSLYKAAWVYLRNEQDIADALQNTILSCYEKIQGLREVKYFKTWLMRILINECKDILRQKNHAAELDDFAEGVHCEELNLCEWKQLLLCLDEESRKIVELYYFDEFSVKEISALLEMNSNTVSTKLSRARAKLKKVIRR